MQYANSNRISRWWQAIPKKSTSSRRTHRATLSKFQENNRKYDEMGEEAVSIARRLFGYQTTKDSHQPPENFGCSSSSSFNTLAELQKRTSTASACASSKVGKKRKSAIKPTSTSTSCVARKSRLPTSRKLSADKNPKVRPAEMGKDWGEICAGVCRKMCRANFPTPRACSRSNGRAKIPRACSRAKADRSAPTSVSTTYHWIARGAAQHGIRLRDLVWRRPRLSPRYLWQNRQFRREHCCLDDAKKLYSGFDLCEPKTSVSMTINGPAATIAAFFMNAAIDQQCEKYIRENGLEAEVKAKYDQLPFTPRKRHRPNPDLPRRTPRRQRRPRPDAAGQSPVTEVLPADVYAKIRKPMR
jgi:methylmalonyl-CoA mutase